MLFDGWTDVGRVAFLGSASYGILVVALRLSGKRTLSKLNAFDLVVTVALGSVLATITLSKDVSLVDGLTAITVLVVAQFCVSRAAVRTVWAQRLVRAEGTIVLADGRFDDIILHRMRLTRAEVCQAVRASGTGDLEAVAAVVLEADGTLSVVAADRCHSASALPPMAAA